MTSSPDVEDVKRRARRVTMIPIILNILIIFLSLTQMRFHENVSMSAELSAAKIDFQTKLHF